MGALEVPPEFVLPVEYQPGLVRGVDEDEDIPLIDLGNWNDAAVSRRDVVEKIGRAAAEWGFFKIINHGVPLELLDQLEESARRFFALPLEEKRKVVRSADVPMGYFNEELTKNVRDWKEVFDFLVGEKVRVFENVMENRWPLQPPEFRKACSDYAAAVQNLAFKVLELISESLGLPSKELNSYFEKETSSRIRLNHYEKCPAPHLVLGVSRHSDGCALTLLAQDQVGGLQVRPKREGKWISVKPHRGAFAVNIGDLIQVWSNGRYKSVEHRVVVNSNSDRFSCPLFFGPSYSTDVAPLPALVDEDHPPKYRAVNWGEYYMMRRDSNFKNLGKPNVQIDNWAI